MTLQVNQKVELKILDGPSRGAYVTRVEEIGRAGEVKLALPVNAGVPITVVPGDLVRCEFAEEGMACSFVTRCAGRELGPVPRLVLQAPERIDRIQRRDYVRLDVSLPVRFSVVGVPGGLEYDAVLTFQTRTRDLSGGGALLLAPLRLVPGSRLDLLIELPDARPVHTPAEVVRLADEQASLEQPGPVWATGVRFIGIDDRDREAIIRFIFGEQRERRRKGLM